LTAPGFREKATKRFEGWLAAAKEVCAKRNHSTW
jgi:hypothetical protein